ncbi:MAG: hypothetical protein D3925_21020, partial [Candidatus Electrothrix sp. AR5]|nr:hypothetical protein [Candidatus Electrothrix sp. AR5]
AEMRAGLRRLFADKAVIRSTVVKKKQEEGVKFRDYFDWQEAANKAPSHRLLAMFRGGAEKILRLAVRPDEDAALALLKRKYSSQGRFREQLALAGEDSYKRLLGPSLENELRAELKQRADQEAIKVFADNLKELLLAPALGQKRVMALDPGFRTGAKLVCLSEQGKLLDNTTIYPTHGKERQEEAGRIITKFCKKHRIQAIAIGNGTAGRETEQFVRELGLAKEILITLVNESGASIYSASEVARQEFPDHDITVRGAVSIGRRLNDLGSQSRPQARDIGKQFQRTAVHLHPHRIYAMHDHVIQALFQGGLIDIMLILAHPDGGGIKLDQFCQR